MKWSLILLFASVVSPVTVRGCSTPGPSPEARRRTSISPWRATAIPSTARRWTTNCRPNSTSEAETKEVFALADKLDHFKHPLESPLKVAFMGTKTFRYEEGAEKTEVKFNYSEDVNAQALQDWFERMAESAEHRDNLERAAKYDHLGRDAGHEPAGFGVRAQAAGGGGAVPAHSGPRGQERNLHAQARALAAEMAEAIRKGAAVKWPPAAEARFSACAVMRAALVSAICASLWAQDPRPSGRTAARPGGSQLERDRSPARHRKVPGAAPRPPSVRTWSIAPPRPPSRSTTNAVIRYGEASLARVPDDTKLLPAVTGALLARTRAKPPSTRSGTGAPHRGTGAPDAEGRQSRQCQPHRNGATRRIACSTAP
jgi:invasion protein IalB